MAQHLEPEHLSALYSSPLFRDMESDILEEILTRPGCTLNHFPAGIPIYQPNQFLRCLGVVLSGQVRVTKAPLTVSILNPGSLFGAAALYNEEPDYATTLTPLTPCTVLLMTQELLDRLLSEQPALRQNYLRYLSGRIRFLSARLQTLAAGDTEERLVRYLIDNLTDGTLICSATELSRRLGISRASLYRAFETLESSGLIQRHGKTISIPDPAALAAVI